MDAAGLFGSEEPSPFGMVSSRSPRGAGQPLAAASLFGGTSDSQPSDAHPSLQHEETQLQEMPDDLFGGNDDTAGSLFGAPRPGPVSQPSFPPGAAPARTSQFPPPAEDIPDGLFGSRTKDGADSFGFGGDDAASWSTAGAGAQVLSVPNTFEHPTAPPPDRDLWGAPPPGGDAGALHGRLPQQSEVHSGWVSDAPEAGSNDLFGRTASVSKEDHPRDSDGGFPPVTPGKFKAGSPPSDAVAPATSAQSLEPPPPRVSPNSTARGPLSSPPPTERFIRPPVGVFETPPASVASSGHGRETSPPSAGNGPGGMDELSGLALRPSSRNRNTSPPLQGLRPENQVHSRLSALTAVPGPFGGLQPGPPAFSGDELSRASKTRVGNGAQQAHPGISPQFPGESSRIASGPESSAAGDGSNGESSRVVSRSPPPPMAPPPRPSLSPGLPRSPGLDSSPGGVSLESRPVGSPPGIGATSTSDNSWGKWGPPGMGNRYLAGDSESRLPAADVFGSPPIDSGVSRHAYGGVGDPWTGSRRGQDGGGNDSDSRVDAGVRDMASTSVFEVPSAWPGAEATSLAAEMQDARRSPAEEVFGVSGGADDEPSTPWWQVGGQHAEAEAEANNTKQVSQEAGASETSNAALIHAPVDDIPAPPTDPPGKLDERPGGGGIDHPEPAGTSRASDATGSTIASAGAMTSGEYPSATDSTPPPLVEHHETPEERARDGVAGAGSPPREQKPPSEPDSGGLRGTGGRARFPQQFSMDGGLFTVAEDGGGGESLPGEFSSSGFPGQQIGAGSTSSGDDFAGLPVAPRLFTSRSSSWRASQGNASVTVASKSSALVREGRPFGPLRVASAGDVPSEKDQVTGAASSELEACTAAPSGQEDAAEDERKATAGVDGSSRSPVRSSFFDIPTSQASYSDLFRARQEDQEASEHDSKEHNFGTALLGDAGADQCNHAPPKVSHPSAFPSSPPSEAQRSISTPNGSVAEAPVTRDAGERAHADEDEGDPDVKGAYARSSEGVREAPVTSEHHVAGDVQQHKTAGGGSLGEASVDAGREMPAADADEGTGVPGVQKSEAGVAEEAQGETKRSVEALPATLSSAPAPGGLSLGLHIAGGDDYKRNGDTPVGPPAVEDGGLRSGAAAPVSVSEARGAENGDSRGHGVWASSVAMTRGEDATGSRAGGLEEKKGFGEEGEVKDRGGPAQQGEEVEESTYGDDVLSVAETTASDFFAVRRWHLALFLSPWSRLHPWGCLPRA